MTLAGHFAGVNRDRPKSYSAWAPSIWCEPQPTGPAGGYEALRMTIIDDLRLGLLLRRAGCRTRGFIGGDDLQCDWGVNATRMIAHMEKNYFAAADFRMGAAICLEYRQLPAMAGGCRWTVYRNRRGDGRRLGLLVMIRAGEHDYETARLAGLECDRDALFSAAGLLCHSAVDGAHAAAEWSLVARHLLCARAIARGERAVKGGGPQKRGSTGGSDSAPSGRSAAAEGAAEGADQPASPCPRSCSCAMPPTT